MGIVAIRPVIPPAIARAGTPLRSVPTGNRWKLSEKLLTK